MAREPWRALGMTRGAPSDAPLADLLDTLVIEADGTVVPVQYGFARTHALGCLMDAPLPVLAARWRADGGYERFRAHCEGALRSAMDDTQTLPVFNWYESLAAA